jgi:hypothetical protein
MGVRQDALALDDDAAPGRVTRRLLAPGLVSLGDAASGAGAATLGALSAAAAAGAWLVSSAANENVGEITAKPAAEATSSAARWRREGFTVAA